eukprot:TRINITY_DN2791_c0_g2_i2.p1 TRINITY_DN2791_c0_g2~~TRINITY_DN2791_c0_g2_i2.p1  ORF type:complete len:237 (+),score=24.68 TRINITY_DN2791_c0_g2_i2:20-730(+)
MLTKNSPRQTQVSWYLVVQHDLAVNKGRFFHRECLKEEVTDTCKSWQNQGTAHLSFHFAWLHLTILQQLAFQDVELTSEIVVQIRALGEIYAPAVKKSIDQYDAHRRSQVGNMQVEKTKSKTCRCYLMDNFSGTKHWLNTFTRTGRRSFCGSTDRSKCSTWDRTKYLNSIKSKVKEELREPAEKLFLAFEQKALVPVPAPPPPPPPRPPYRRPPSRRPTTRPPYRRPRTRRGRPRR